MHQLFGSYRKGRIYAWFLGVFRMSWLPHSFLKVINKIFFILCYLLIHDLSIHNKFQFIIAVVIFLMITLYPLWWGNFVLQFLASWVSACNVPLLSGLLKCSVCTVCLLEPGLELATRREGNNTNLNNGKTSSPLTFY